MLSFMLELLLEQEQQLQPWEQRHEHASIDSLLRGKKEPKARSILYKYLNYK